MGCKKGMKSLAAFSGGRRDFNFVVMTEAICATVYGRNGSSCGLRFLAFNRGRNRSVRSSALAMPTRTSLDEGLSDHSNKV